MAEGAPRASQVVVGEGQFQISDFKFQGEHVRWHSGCTSCKQYKSTEVVIMRRSQCFEDLKVYKDARSLISDVYTTTRQSAMQREHALVNQIKRSAFSITANIAEGYERDGNKELRQFLAVAKASAGELRAHIHTCHDIGLITQHEHTTLIGQCKEVSRQLSGLMRYLQKTSISGRKYKS